MTTHAPTTTTKSDPWAAVAAGWATHADYADTRGAGLTRKMLAATAPAPGERVLELACGPGAVGIAAAPLVAPAGEVVCSDVAAAMTEIAAERAQARGLTNVRTRVLDLDAIDEPDASFDVVVCREGWMFAADHAGAAREFRRVLAPGGRIAVAVWGPRDRNPWLGVVFDAVGEELGIELPPPGVHGLFALAEAGEVDALLRAAQFAEVTIDAVDVPLRTGSFDEWWERTSALAGPLAAMLAMFDANAQRALRARLVDAVAPYETDGGLSFPGVALLATARR
jgi:SAM-dependent methyltransferase